jgi:hypothetical protein
VKSFHVSVFSNVLLEVLAVMFAEDSGLLGCYTGLLGKLVLYRYHSVTSQGT